MIVVGSLVDVYRHGFRFDMLEFEWGGMENRPLAEDGNCWFMALRRAKRQSR